MNAASDLFLLVANEFESADIATFALTPIRNSRDGVGFRAETSIGPVIVKLRREPQPLEASARAADILRRAMMAHQEVVLSPRSTAAGWLMGQRWIEGRTLAGEAVSCWSQATAAGFGFEIGQWLRRLHALPAPQLNWRFHADTRLMSKLAASVARNCISTRIADVVNRRWLAVRPHLDNASTALVHRDLIRSNLLESEGSLAGVIDFEQSIFADPLYDIVKLADHVLPLHPALSPGFRRGYGVDFHSDHTAARLWAVFVLERLSSIPYFYDMGDERSVALQRTGLEELLSRPLCLPYGAFDRSIDH